MSELTKKHFDQTLKELVTKKGLEQALQKAVAPLATKQDVRAEASKNWRG